MIKLPEAAVLARQYDIRYFERKIRGAEAYLTNRIQYGYPHLKTKHDIYIEQQLLPLYRECLTIKRALANEADK